MILKVTQQSDVDPYRLEKSSSVHYHDRQHDKMHLDIVFSKDAP
jgi:hypothetical protein